MSLIIEYIYTDTASDFSDSLKQLAEQFQLPRLVALCNVYTEISIVNLREQYPSRLVKDAKAVYMDCISSSDTNEAKIELICSDQTRIFVYKVVLLSTDYFRGMLHSGMQESKTSTIHLPEISAKSMKYVVEYLLTGFLTCEDGNDLLELFIAANQLCILSLSNLCQILLAKQIDESNVQTILEFSTTYSASMLQNSCKKFTKKNKVPEKQSAHVVWPYQDFLEIMEEQIQGLNIEGFTPGN